MSITRVKPAGWAINEKLTSAQMNGVDINTTRALDKRSGQFDTLASTVTMSSGSGVTVSSGATLQFLSGSTFLVSSGTTFTVNSDASFGNTVSFADTVTHTGTVIFEEATVFGRFVTASFNGDVEYTNTSSILHDANSEETYEPGSTINFGISPGTSVSGVMSGTLQFIGTLTMPAATTINVAGITNYASTSSTTFSAGSTISTSGTISFGSSSTFNCNTDVLLSTANGADILYTAPRSFTKVLTNYLGYDSIVSGEWYLSGIKSSVLASTADAIEMGWSIDLPQGCTVTDYTIFIQPGSGHAGLPSNRPSCKIVELDLSDGTVTNFGVTTDLVPANVTQYEQHHSVSPTAFSMPVNNNQYRYALIFTNESGANAEAFLEVFGATITYSTSAPDPAK